MEFLPIDYYILLQEGYENKPFAQDKSSHMFYSNLPLLAKKRSYLKQSTDIVKNVTYEDVMRALDRTEAEGLLLDTFAEEELRDHLTSKFGPIKDMFHINYRTQEILLKFARYSRDVATDEVQQFEQALANKRQPSEQELIEEASFEDLLLLANKDFELSDDAPATGKASDGKALTKKSKNVEEVVEDLRRKQRQQQGLDRQVNRSGFLVFEDRASKLKMMSTPLFLFGMKLHRQEGYMEFFDADFCNTVLVSSDELLADISLRDACAIINETLIKAGFDEPLLAVGKLKDLEFDLGKILVRKNFQVSLRFNSFADALKGFKCLTQGNARFKAFFMNPSPNYYDGRMATQFETCIKDKFEGLLHINEVPATYVKDELRSLSAERVTI